MGRHEHRYWDGTQWTEHVSDAGRGSSDPLVAPTAPVGGGPGPTPSAGVAPAYAGVPTYPPTGYRPTAGDPTAVLGRRYLAFFIDLVITLVAFSILFVPLAKQRTVDETLRLPGCHVNTNDTIQCDNRAVFRVGDTVYEARIGPFALAEIGFTFLYFGVLTGLAGATLGKLAAGIRVVKEDGSKVGVGRSLIRWILFAVDGPLTLFLCGIITSSTSRGHRRLGDMGAQSYVVAAADAGRGPIRV